jgi:signal transduction histidine kinase
MRRLGLRVQIVVSLAVLLGIALSLVGFTVLALARRALIDQATDTATLATRAVVAELDQVRGDRERLRRSAGRALGRAGIDAIRVWDASDRLVLDLSMPGRSGRLAATDPRHEVDREELVEDAGGPRLVSVTILRAPRGAVAVDAALDDALESLDRVRELTLLYVAVSALALLVFGYVAMTRLIVRPLTGLRYAAERVAAGVFDTRVPVEGGTEVAELAEGFNSMTGQLRAQREELQARLVELERRTLDLQAVQEHLVRSAKLASVGQLAAGVAHEIGNPVSAILGFCDILAEGDSTPEEAKDFVLRMKKEAERMNRIIRDLLDYARPSREAQEPEGGCDLASVIEDSTSLLAPQKSFREIEVERVLPERLPNVRGSRERLTQVLVNLLINAADAMGGTGLVRVDADLLEPWRRPDGTTVPRAVRLRVADSGPGISAATLPGIFDPFYTTKEPGHGTGLGLAVCQGIVTSLGGMISADNDPAGGAVFTVVLPAEGTDVP